MSSELDTPKQIRSIQGQLRTAILNHQFLYERSLVYPKNVTLLNHMKIMQDLIFAIGRKQHELMTQYRSELAGLVDDEFVIERIMQKDLSWADKNDLPKYVKPPKDNVVTDEKRVQVVKKKAALLVKSGCKLKSLLKPNAGTNVQLRKVSERLKAQQLKHTEPSASSNQGIRVKKMETLLKPKTTSKPAEPSSRRSSISDEKSSTCDSENILDSKSDTLSDPPLGALDKASSLEDVSQDQYLELFGLINKVKSKSIVVSQSKRKRRSVAGQSNFYNDYLQPRRYTKKPSAASGSVPESPSSSQDLVESRETSPSKPSEPASPVSSEENAEETKLEIVVSDDSKSPAKVEKPEPIEVEDDDPKEEEKPEELDRLTPNVVAAAGVASGAYELKPENIEEQASPEEVKGENNSDPNRVEDSEEVIHEGNIETDKVQAVAIDESKEDKPKVEPVDETKPDDDQREESKPLEDEQKDESICLVDDEQEDNKPLEDSESQEDNKPLEDDKQEESKPFEDEQNDESICLADDDQDDTNLFEDGKPLEIDEEEDSKTLEDDEEENSKPPEDDEQEETQPLEAELDKDMRTTPEPSTKEVEEICSVCLDSGDTTLEKCTVCGERFHKECTSTADSSCPNCTSHSQTPSSISSIVGVNSDSSTLTSTDCSEVVKRYLEDNKGEAPTIESIPLDDQEDSNT